MHHEGRFQPANKKLSYRQETVQRASSRVCVWGGDLDPYVVRVSVESVDLDLDQDSSLDADPNSNQDSDVDSQPDEGLDSDLDGAWRCLR